MYNEEETNEPELKTMKLITFDPTAKLEDIRKSVVGIISRKENGKNLSKALLVERIEAHNAIVLAAMEPEEIEAEDLTPYGPVWAVPVAMSDLPYGPVWQFVSPTIAPKFAVKRDRPSKPKARKAVKTSPIVGAKPIELKVDDQPTQDRAEDVVTLREFETLVGSAYATIYRNLGLGKHHGYGADKMNSIAIDFNADLSARAAIWESKKLPISWVSIYISTRKRSK